MAAVKNNKLRKLFLMLCNEEIDIQDRYKAAMGQNKIYGCSKNIITKILAAHDPDKYMLWNGVTDKVMRNYNICFERGTKEYQKYNFLCSEFKDIMKELDIKDFVVLDAMLLALPK